MKKNTLLIILLLLFTQSVIANSAGIEFTKIINKAYNYYISKDYQIALNCYKTSLYYACSENEFINAKLGIQNCLIKLNKPKKAIKWGKKILENHYDNLNVFLNTGYAYFLLKKYEKSNIFYLIANKKYPKNILALKGLFWNYYYLNDYNELERYAHRILKIEPDNKTVWDIYKKLINKSLIVVKQKLKKNKYQISSYYTYLNYKNSSKDKGHQYDLYLSSSFKHKIYYDVGYSNVNIKFIDDSEPDVKEDYFVLKTNFYTRYPFGFSYKNIISNQEYFGDGNIFYGNLIINKFMFQTAYSQYANTNANQFGIGFSYKIQKLNCLSLIDYINQKKIEHFNVSKQYTTFSQKINYINEPFKIGWDFNIGKNMLLIKEKAFLVNNVPEEINWSSSVQIKYLKNKYEFSYIIGFVNGKNIIDDDKFDLLTHTINFNIRW